LGSPQKILQRSCGMDDYENDFEMNGELDRIHKEIEFDRQQAEIENEPVSIGGHDILFIKKVLEDQRGFHGRTCFCKDIFICIPIPEEKRYGCPICQIETAIEIIDRNI
jgi:hypothetical protein